MVPTQRSVEQKPQSLKTLISVAAKQLENSEEDEVCEIPGWDSEF